MRVRISLAVWDDFDRPWQVSGEIVLRRLPARGDRVDITNGLASLAKLGFPSSLRVDEVLIRPAMKRGEEAFSLRLGEVDARSPEAAAKICGLLEEHLGLFVDPRD